MRAQYPVYWFRKQDSPNYPDGWQCYEWIQETLKKNRPATRRNEWQIVVHIPGWWLAQVSLYHGCWHRSGDSRDLCFKPKTHGPSILLPWFLLFSRSASLSSDCGARLPCRSLPRLYLRFPANRASSICIGSSAVPQHLTFLFNDIRTNLPAHVVPINWCWMWSSGNCFGILNTLRTGGVI